MHNQSSAENAPSAGTHPRVGHGRRTDRVATARSSSTISLRAVGSTGIAKLSRPIKAPIATLAKSDGGVRWKDYIIKPNWPPICAGTRRTAQRARQPSAPAFAPISRSSAAVRLAATPGVKFHRELRKDPRSARAAGRHLRLIDDSSGSCGGTRQSGWEGAPRTSRPFEHTVDLEPLRNRIRVPLDSHSESAHHPD